MRITNGILRAESLPGMQPVMRVLRESQTEIVTERRFETASGDPSTASHGRGRQMVIGNARIGLRCDPRRAA